MNSNLTVDMPALIRDLDTLSDRELMVFRCLGRGMSTREIAQDLEVNIKTIDTYRRRIKAKLNVTTTNKLTLCAVLWTVHNGLIRAEIYEPMRDYNNEREL